MVVKSLTSMPNKRLGWEKSKRVIRRQLWSNISLYNISCMWISTVSEENKVYLLGRRNSNSVFKSEPSNLGSFLPGHQQGSYQLPVRFWESLPLQGYRKEGGFEIHRNTSVCLNAPPLVPELQSPLLISEKD